jgi:hypothetical protein
MPRKVSRIRLADDHLEQMDVLSMANCLWGHAWTFGDWPDLAKYQEAWRLWGDELVRCYPKAYPASRPVIMYYLDLVPAPPAARQTPPEGLQLRSIPGMKPVIRNTAWHMQKAEADWLLKSKVVDEAEYRRGLERIKDPANSSVHVYREIAGY